MGEKVPFLMHLRAKLKWEAAKDPYMAPSLMGGRRLHPFSELVVVLVQLLQALLRGELDADAQVRSGPVEPFDLE